jgi:hypothetical protein
MALPQPRSEKMKKKNNGYLDKDLIPRLFIGADLIIREAFEIFV